LNNNKLFFIEREGGWYYATCRTSKLRRLLTISPPASELADSSKGKKANSLLSYQKLDDSVKQQDMKFCL